MSEKRSGRIFSDYIPLPMCKVDTRGKVLNASPGIDQVFLYDGIKGGIYLLSRVSSMNSLQRPQKTKRLLLYTGMKKHSG